jgi:hypothetical protein
MEALVKFRPLTYFEVVTELPYQIPFDKRIYSTQLMNCVNVIRVFELKDAIMNNMNKAALIKQEQGEGFTSISVTLIQGYISMAHLLYEICDKPKFFFTRWRYRSAFIRYCLKHTDFLWTVWDQVLSYNARSLQCNTVPSELQSDTGNNLEADGFYLQCEGFDPKNTNWRTVQLKHEHEKYRAIAQFLSTKKSNKNGR